jgi:pimeloyl-ACP methyl ester carboxylesterase
MPRYLDGAFRAPARDYQWTVAGSPSCQFVVVQPNHPDLSLRPVISLHGWSGASTSVTTLVDNLTASQTAVGFGAGLPIDGFLATGRTVYMTFTGSNFGHLTTVSPSTTYGNGLEVVDEVIAHAAALGLETDTVDLVGGSMGACNALNWAWRNEASVHRVFLYVPALDFDSLYDLGGGIQSCLIGVYGGANKAATLAAAADNDPSQQTLSAGLAAKCLAYLSDPDVLIDYAATSAILDGWGVPYATGSSDHFSLDDPEFDELAVLTHLA